MKNSFKEQISAILQSRENVLENKINQEQQKAIDGAKYDYNRLKSEIINYVKKQWICNV